MALFEVDTFLASLFNTLQACDWLRRTFFPNWGLCGCQGNGNLFHSSSQTALPGGERADTLQLILFEAMKEQFSYFLLHIDQQWLISLDSEAALGLNFPLMFLTTPL